MDDYLTMIRENCTMVLTPKKKRELADIEQAIRNRTDFLRNWHIAQLGEIVSEMESNVKRFETELNYDEVRRNLAEALAVLQDVPAVQKAPAAAKKLVAKQSAAKVLELDIQRLEAARQQAKRKVVGFGYAAASVFAGLLISGAAAMLSVRRT